MRILKTLFGQLAAIFITLNIVWFGIVFLLLPQVGIDMPGVHSSLFMLQATLFIAVFLILIYFITKKHNTQIQQQIKNTHQIVDRYEALSAATNDAVWDYNLITGETFYNSRLLRIFGYTKEELQDNTNWWASNIHPNDKERVTQKINNLLANNGTIWQDEYQFRCKNKTYKTVYDRSYIVRDESGKPIRLIGAMNDLTVMRKLEKKFLREQLENKNNLGKAIILAHEEERKKLREELHEDVNQVLASVKLHINQANVNQVNNSAVMHQGLSYLDDAMQKIKKISNSLVPPSLEYFGLLSAVTNLAEDMENNFPSTDINILHDSFDESKVAQEIKSLVYRIIQDSFRCILHQDSVTKIWVDLSNTDGKIRLALRFNGVVSNRKKRESHITELQTKLELYNGRMHICTEEPKENMLEIHL
jgi:two-component system, NarL family, sensor histidine kinase UhpB